MTIEVGGKIQDMFVPKDLEIKIILNYMVFHNV